VADYGGYGNEGLGFIKGWGNFVQITVFGSDSMYYVMCLTFRKIGCFHLKSRRQFLDQVNGYL